MKVATSYIRVVKSLPEVFIYWDLLVSVLLSLIFCAPTGVSVYEYLACVVWLHIWPHALGTPGSGELDQRAYLRQWGWVIGMGTAMGVDAAVRDLTGLGLGPPLSWERPRKTYMLSTVSDSSSCILLNTSFWFLVRQAQSFLLPLCLIF